MLKLSNSLLGKSVMSLRTGTAIASITSPIINPNNLKIEGFYCQDRFDKQELVLLCQDIRELLPQGFVVNDHSVLVESEDLIRLKDTIEIAFEPIGKHVVTIAKEKIGKVSDYAVETDSMYIQKLYVSQSIIKSFTGGSLSIDRSQVNEVTSKKIIINELLKTAPAAATATAA